MAETVMNRGKHRVQNTDVTGATLFMAYFTGTATGTDDPDLNTVADLEAVAGVTVDADRQQLATITSVENDTDNRAELRTSGDAGVSFDPNPATTAEGVAIYFSGASDAARDLLAVYTTGFPQPVDGGLDVNIPNGFFRLS